MAATNTDTAWRFKETKKSGLMGTGGIGFTLGSSKTTHDLKEAGTTQSQSFSTVGSTGGSVAISAGNQAHIGGADLVAGKDLNLSGSRVIIEPGHDKRTRDETFEQKKSGLTVALSGTVGSAINNAVSAVQDAHEESDGRLAALQATKAALSGVQAGQAVDIARTQGDLNGLKKAQSNSKTTLPANATEKERQDYLAGLRNSQAYKEEMEKFGTGSDIQRGIQAATAALQGLAGGNIGGALAGASAPELANIIGHHAGIDDNTAAKAIAHAILGGVTAALQGNNAAAGAVGAGSGELVAVAIARSLYPNTDPSKLTEDQKQTVSTLATLSAGMAGGIAGGNVSGAAAGASAGKNAVENNLVAGNEDAQAAWIRQHGIDMASCGDAPGSASCQKAQNERDAVALALAAGGTASLSGEALAMWGLGASANAGISYLADGTIDPANAVIAGWVNVISMGNGLAGTVGWNAAGGAFGNWIDGKNPTSGALVNGAGSAIGYGIGKGISLGVNSGVNWWKGGWDPKFNPMQQKYSEIKGDFGISKGVQPSNIPGSFGDLGGSFSSEYGGKKLEPIIEDKLK